MNSNKHQIQRVNNAIKHGENFVFLSSLLGGEEEIREKRQEIHDTLNLRDDLIPIYVDEIDNALSSIKDEELYEISDTLAYKVQKCKFVIIIFSKINPREPNRKFFDHGYIIHDTLVSMWEIELYLAAIYQKPIYAIIEDGFEAQKRPRLMNCLQLIELSATIYSRVERKNFTKQIEQIISNKPKTNSINVYQYLRSLYNVSKSRFNSDLGFYDYQLRTSKFERTAGDVNEIEVKNIIDGVKTLNNNQSKITRLYVAYRELRKAPITDNAFNKYLPLWNEVSSEFSGALAWSGIWGHEILGVINHLNDLSEIRKKLRDNKFDFTYEEISHPYGAYASAYYSMAKLPIGLKDKKELYEKSLHNINLGLLVNEFDRAGLLTIRGSYYINKLNPWKAVDDFKEAYEILKRKATNEYQLADIESHYAFSLFLSSRRAKGLDLINHSLQKFSYLENSGTKARAYRKASYIYFLSGNIIKGFKYRQLAKKIANDSGSLDQIRQL